MNVGIVLLVLAGLGCLAAWIWLIVVAFREKQTGWGIGLIVFGLVGFAPLVALVYMVMNWNVARRPGITFLSSTVLAFIASFMVARSLGRQMVAMQEQAMAQMNQDFGEVSSTVSLEESEPRSTLAESELVSTSVTSEADPTPTLTRPGRTTPPPPPPRRAQSETGDDLAPRVTPARLVSETSSVEPPPPRPRDPRIPPVSLHVLQMGEPTPTRMRMLHVEVRNPSERTVNEISLMLEYLAENGRELGRWRTVHTPPGAIAKPNTTNQIDVRAFNVPLFTHKVRASVEGVTFADGGRWP